MRRLVTRINERARNRQRVVRDERGAVLVFVAVGLVMLLGFTAFTIDYGRIYSERRELQNGADAAALAVAQDCAIGDCGTSADRFNTAEEYADANASDDLAWVDEIDLDLAAQQVRVHTVTEDPGGDHFFDMALAQIVGFDGLTVTAEATVAWGAPKGGATLPLIFSTCEWERITGDIPGFDDIRIPWSGWPAEGDLPDALPPEKRATIYIHGKEPSVEGLSPCHDSPSGADLPGGFGWLDTGGGDCEALINEDDIVVDDPGSSVSTGCSPDFMANLVGKIVLIPYFKKFEGVGSNGEYTVAGFGAMYVTGYNFGGSYKEPSLILPKELPCDGSDRCIEGYFIEDYKPPFSGEIGGGDFGVVITKLVK